MQNLDTVRRLYDAFGRGDIATILDHLHDDVEWEYGSTTTEVPWLRPIRGRASVPGYFQALGLLEFRRFEPHTLLEAGDTVVALINLEVALRANGAVIREEDEAHIWHFRDGKVARFRHRVDTHQHLEALRGQLVPPPPVG